MMLIVKKKRNAANLRSYDQTTKNHPNDVVCKLEAHLPIDEYLELLKANNVVIDQVYSKRP